MSGSQKKTEVEYTDVNSRHPGAYIRRHALVITVALVAVFLVASGIFYIVSVRNSGDADVAIPTTKQGRIEAADKIGSDISVQAQTFVEAKDVSQVEKIYAEAIAKHEKEQYIKAYLYTGLATALVSLKQDQKALTAAQTAYGLDTENLYMGALLPLIGYTAYRLGQKEVALDYLRKTYEFQQNDPNLEAGVLEETKNFIADLEKAQ